MAALQAMEADWMFRAIGTVMVFGVRWLCHRFSKLTIT